MTPAKVLYLILLCTALALLLVWQSSLARSVGYEVQDLHAEAAEQRAENAAYVAQLGKLKNPRRILALVAWLGLDLHEPPVEAETDTTRTQPQETSSDRTAPVAVAEAQPD